MKAVLLREAPGIGVVDLFADAPFGDPQSGAYLLAAYAAWFPAQTVFLCVVDPGVGSAREAVVIEADGRRFVGPDNGLFEIVLRRATAARVFQIAWRPDQLTASFHGRDLFAPVAAMLARGDPPPGAEGAVVRMPDWPDELSRIVYIDHYGNAMTGTRAAALPKAARLSAGGRTLSRVRTFSDVPRGSAFWYENANGLAEIAVNGGRADRALGIAVGSAVGVRA